MLTVEDDDQGDQCLGQSFESYTNIPFSITTSKALWHTGDSLQFNSDDSSCRVPSDLTLIIAYQIEGSNYCGLLIAAL